VTESKQSARGVRVRGEIHQTSGADKATQSVADASAKELKQSANTKDRLGLGKYSAAGKWAVLALVVIVAIVVAAQVWMNQRVP